MTQEKPQSRLSNAEQANESKAKEIEELEAESVKTHQVSEPTVGRHHEWKQQGPFVNCFSCQSPHGFYIGTNRRLKGINKDGSLIIEKVN